MILYYDSGKEKGKLIKSGQIGMTHSQIFLFLRRGKKRVLPKPGPSIPRDFNFKKVKSPTVHGLTFQIGHGPSMSRSVNATVHKSPNSTRSLGPAEHCSESRRSAGLPFVTYFCQRSRISSQCESSQNELSTESDSHDCR